MPPSRIHQLRTLPELQKSVIECRKCPRLIEYCRKVAREKRRAYRDWTYWGKPVPSFGDRQAQLLILGLAPAAHGANRTGRMFTGDRSGDFLYRALFRAGIASQPHSSRPNDGLQLRNCYITASLRCAPPANKPLPAELARCRPYLEQELRLLEKVRAVLVLGRIAFDSYLRILTAQGQLPARLRKTFLFRHGASYALPGGLPRLFVSYHPSQQNTQTGRLTEIMFQSVFHQIRHYLGSTESGAAWQVTSLGV